MSFFFFGTPWIYPQNILETIDKYGFVPHINYGLLLWGRNLDFIAKFQKRVIIE